jgi:hypothetical protein
MECNKLRRKKLSRNDNDWCSTVEVFWNVLHNRFLAIKGNFEIVHLDAVTCNCGLQKQLGF